MAGLDQPAPAKIDAILESPATDDDEHVARFAIPATEGIYSTDADGNCTFASSSCVRLLGFSDSSELIGKNVRDMVQHNAGQVAMRRSDGSSFPVEFNSQPILASGADAGSLVTFVDIEARQALQDELRQAERMAALGRNSASLVHELNNPAAAATRASDQLDEAISDLQAVIGKVCDSGLVREDWEAFLDWQTTLPGPDDSTGEALSPLEISDLEEEINNWLDMQGVEDGWEISPALVTSGVRLDTLESLAERLSIDSLEAVLHWYGKVYSARDQANVVSKSCSSISSIVGSVKSYSHRDQAAIQKIDVLKGIEDALRMLEHKLSSGVQVVKEFDRDLPQVEVRGQEMNQVWINLIDNSLAALDGSGTITLGAASDGQNVVIKVQDDGPGIPEEIQERVFEQFFTTKPVGVGTGIGLDVVRRIITQRAGGDVTLKSKPGETIFTITLPVSADRAEKSA